MRNIPASFYVHILLTPLALSILGLLLSMGGDFTFILMLVIYAAAGFLAGKSIGIKSTAEGLASRYFPVYIPIFVTTLVAAILMVISEGFTGHDAWGVYTFMLFPFLPFSFIAALMGKFLLALLAPILYYFFLLIGFFSSERRSAHKAMLNRRTVGIAVSLLILFTAVSAGVMWQRSQHVLPSYGFEYENGYSSVDLYPYTVTNSDNRLPSLDEPANFTIESRQEMPILDGAEAAFPVYSAFAKAAYKNIGSVNALDNGREIVAFTNTIYAFEQLVDGEVDIFFGAQPSKAQQQLAAAKGKELVLTPIGKEAFVFFVNGKNKMTSLTSEELKGIYSGKITNWQELGGSSAKIVAFQRPADSGSQTIMEKFMGDTPLIDPLKEEIAGMGDVMEQVANYRNYEGAIGYSFRFFTTGMNPNSKIKLLSLNGIEPSAENIAAGTYPYVVNLYAISVKDNPKTTIQPMLEWMQGPQGQKLVEEVGYIPLESAGN